MTDDLHTLGQAMRDAQRAYRRRDWYKLTAVKDAEAAFDKALAETPAAPPAPAVLNAAAEIAKAYGREQDEAARNLTFPQFTREYRDRANAAYEIERRIRAAAPPVPADVAGLVRAAFDSDEVPRKNIALRKAHAALTAQAVEIERLTRGLAKIHDDLGGAIHAAEAAEARATAQAARVAELERLLEGYREAVRIDVKMEGPRFLGSDASALKRAWDADRAALAASETPASGEGDADDTLNCEACGKRFPSETMHRAGDACYICSPCYTDWKACFDACEHTWQPGHFDGDDGLSCEKCGGFVRELPAPPKEGA